MADEITYEEATKTVGTLPSLAPRPNATNIRALTADLVDKLLTIPSPESTDLGYSGLVLSEEIYLLDSQVPWQGTVDPGPQFEIDVTWADIDKEQEEIYYKRQKVEWDNEVNIRRAIVDALNKAVPKAYRRGTGTRMGARVYRATDEPRDILNKLHELYGKMTPQEKSNMEAAWSAPWAPSDPIKTLIDRLEECFILAKRNKPAYTVAQMIDKALTAIQSTGLFPIAVLEWNGFDENNKTWPEFKSHFIEAYEIWLTSGAGAASSNNGYHGAANAQDNADDDSITTALADSMQQLQMANNTNAHALNDAITALTQDIAGIRQQMALQATCIPAPAPPPQIQYIQPPIQNAYAAMAPPAYVPPPAAGAPQYQQTRRSGGRNNGRGRGGRTGGRFSAQPPTPAAVPAPGGIPPPGGIPAPAQPTQRRNNEKNYTKRFANWNVCFSCGWDVPAWHTSKTCQWKVPGHRDEVDRTNAKAYKEAGHPVNMSKHHRNKLPENPGAHQM